MDLNISCTSVIQVNSPSYKNVSVKSRIASNLQKIMNMDLIRAYTTSNNTMQEGIMTMDSGNIQIKHLEIDGLRLKFINPFFLNYIYDGKYYQYEYSNLNYFGIAETIEDMIEQFKEDIYSDWMVYVENDSVQLSKRAEILKNKLLLLLEKIN